MAAEVEGYNLALWSARWATCCFLCGEPKFYWSLLRGWLCLLGWVLGMWSAPLSQHDAEAPGLTFSGDLSQLFNRLSLLLQVCLLLLPLNNVWFILVLYRLLYSPLLPFSAKLNFMGTCKASRGRAEGKRLQKRTVFVCRCG